MRHGDRRTGAYAATETSTSNPTGYFTAKTKREVIQPSRTRMGPKQVRRMPGFLMKQRNLHPADAAKKWIYRARNAFEHSPV